MICFEWVCRLQTSHHECPVAPAGAKAEIQKLLVPKDAPGGHFPHRGVRVRAFYFKWLKIFVDITCHYGGTVFDLQPKISFFLTF